jgi:hypothetical protein
MNLIFLILWCNVILTRKANSTPDDERIFLHIVNKKYTFISHPNKLSYSAGYHTVRMV